MAKKTKVQIENGEMDIIVAQRQEFIAAMDDYVKCSLCGSEEQMFDNMYYIPSIDQVYCERCFGLWKNTARYYKIDQKEIDMRCDKLQKQFEAMGVFERG